MKKVKVVIKNLSKNFESKKVLNNLSLNIYESESLSIIGESGSGKSVLARCICGLIKFDKGEIYVDNTKNVMKMSTNSLNKHIGTLYFIQNSTL